MSPRLTLLVLSSLLLLRASPSLAANPGVNMVDWRPSVHAWDIGGVMSTRMPDPFQVYGGVWFTYRQDALSVGKEGGGISQIIGSQLVGDLVVSMAFFRQLSLGLDIPMMLWIRGDDPALVVPSLEQVGGLSLGDVRLAGKFKFWDNGNKGWGVGLAQDLTIPSATGNNMFGEASVSSLTQFVLDWSGAGYVFAVNTGYLARKNDSAFEPVTADEILIGVGGQIPILCDSLELLLSSQTRSYAASFMASENDVATVFSAGLRGRFDSGLVLQGLGGFSVGTMPGVAAWQATFFVGYEKKANSCDQDGDGVCDRKDLCPAVQGPAEADGCPDLDRDGVLDADDICREVPGKVNLRGCPDKDNDDIADYQDHCPDLAGTKALRGCPDKDRDGISDPQDRCPDQAGIEQFQGCPDSDGDNIPDSEDKCPQQPGSASGKGCPDGDGDGILDKEDKCPEVFGRKEHQGCPPPTPKKVQITREKIVILDVVYFKSNSTRIEAKSFDLLRDVAQVLKDNPWVKLVRVEGHTDDVGPREHNLKLSQGRAESVREFLIKEGVDPARLEAEGYGPDRPLEQARTREARSKNRRVEFTIIESK